MTATSGEVNVGDQIPELVLPPISRATLALYAGASGDHNPIHIDTDAARSAGLDDVIAHGMLSMAYLGRMLTAWRSRSALRSFSVRFQVVTQANDIVACRGTVTELFEEAGECRARLNISAERQSGEITLAGEAIVAI